MKKINFASASQYNSSVELIYNGICSPSWVTIAKLKSEDASCEADFADILSQLGEQEGISWHCEKGKEKTYRICPGIDGFVIAKFLTDALEGISSTWTVLKIIVYDTCKSKKIVDSFEKEVLMSCLNLEPEDRQ